jgi:hypothetical protein
MVDDRSDSRVMTVAVGIFFGIVAAAVAVLSALVSRMVWRPDSHAVPWGLALSVAASVAVVLLARVFSRGIGLATAGVWIVATGLVLAGRPEGDYVFAQDGYGLGYLLISAVAVISAAAAGGPPR